MLIQKDDGSYTTVTMTQQDWGYKEKAKRTYAGLDLYLEHPFDGKWQARIDYTYARARGNTEGQVRTDFGQADVSKTEDWDSWELMEGQDGELMNQRKHSLRMRGAWQFTPEWLVSATVLMQSGMPQECLGYYGPDASGDPTGYNNHGLGNYHWCAGHIVHPGSDSPYAGHTPWTHQLNLGLHYTPAFAHHRLAIKLNVYNVLNEQHAVQTDPTFAAGDHVVSNTFHQGVFFEPPRFVRLSVSYDY
jgi:outer membrane receptor protein involved in Fe transport